MMDTHEKKTDVSSQAQKQAQAGPTKCSCPAWCLCHEGLCLADATPDPGSADAISPVLTSIAPFLCLSLAAQNLASSPKRSSLQCLGKGWAHAP